MNNNDSLRSRRYPVATIATNPTNTELLAMINTFVNGKGNVSREELSAVLQTIVANIVPAATTFGSGANGTKIVLDDTNEQIILNAADHFLFKNILDPTGSLSLNIEQVTDITLGTSATAAVTLGIPAGALILGVQINVKVAITTSAADNTWEAAFTGGSTAAVAATGTLGAANTKVNSLFVPILKTDVTQLLLTAGNSENFATGGVTVKTWYFTFNSMGAV